MSLLQADDMSEPSPEIAEKNGKFLASLTFFSAIGGFLFGYDTGVVSGAMLLINEHFALKTVQQGSGFQQN